MGGAAEGILRRLFFYFLRFSTPHSESTIIRIPMPRLRCFIEPAPELPRTSITLSSAESHHLLNVRRAKRDDPVCVFDGDGNEFECIIRDPTKPKATLTILKHYRAKGPRMKATLAPALLKSRAMDTVIRMATELGASGIIPISTERCEVQLPARRQDLRLRKWRSLAIGVCKQCGRTHLPTIDSVSDFEEVCASVPDSSLRLIASLSPGALEFSVILREFLGSQGGIPPTEVFWLIGPEGDFTEREYGLARNRGFQPVRLGEHVLRAETASTVALTILNYEIRLFESQLRVGK